MYANARPGKSRPPYRIAARVRMGLLASLVALLVWPWSGETAAQQRHRFKVDDLFELEGIGRYYGGPWAFSPDEQNLAFTRVRPKKTLANHKWEYLWDNAGGDVWVQLGPAAEPFNLTDGATDGSGWWSPQWSPDGEELAMLSTRGGNVRLWVWEVGTRELRQVCERGINLVDVRERPYVWVDSEHLLVPVLATGERPLGMIVELQTPAIASAAWATVPGGTVVTASVLESGVPVHPDEHSRGELLLLDLPDGSQTTVARGSTANWQLSPDGKHVAFSVQLTTYQPRADEPLAFGSSEISTVRVVTLEGMSVVFADPVPQDVLARSLRWSPDGKLLAFFGRAASAGEPPLLYSANPVAGTLTSRALAGLDVTPIVREEPQLEWTASGNLVFQAAVYTSAGLPDVTARRDWWVVERSADVAPRNLTADLETVPRLLWPQVGRQAFIGLAGGELWRVVPSGRGSASAASGGSDGADVEELTADFDSEVTVLSWPAMTNRGTDQYRIPGGTYDQTVFSVRDGIHLEPYRLELQSGEIQPIAKPATGAELVAYGPGSRTAIFYADDRTGLGVWRTDVEGRGHTRLVDANGFLRGIDEGELRPIEYTSLNGEPLRGWVILPVGYEAGQQYPLLVWVYVGSVYSDRPPSGYLASIRSSSSLNLQIPAARGYAVLLPSMPLAPEGVTEDPMLRLPEGVLPAVDKVIEMGIADPERLFVMGQSFGGYSTYGLVTQTQRFTGAVALAGLSNLISLYGQFDARVRYTDEPHENLFMMALMESAQVRLGSPPWKDLGRYIRNSPIFFVDRVNTPIMIIQGDLDYVAIQQGEEFFVSLYRQGKRARFVRYWGEGHVLESPANIRDMWKRVFAWFDELSPPGAGS